MITLMLISGAIDDILADPRQATIVMLLILLATVAGMALL